MCRPTSELLGFPVSQSIDEAEMLRKYARLVPKHQCIVEVGTRNGGSALVIAMACQSLVYSIDILADPRWKMKAFGVGEIPPVREHWDSFECGNRIIQVTCKSWEYKHTGPPVGMIFIDGDHTHKGIRNDWNHFYPLLEDGGYILLHDWGQAQGVTDFINKVLPGMNHFPIDEVGCTKVYRKEVKT